ncbi:hypothetical protein PACTADRAFT_49084 [Pachysolen tannophilus NRRL Y-2460]|uniref:Pre-mRNA-splicing factor SPF27 n=1 Tax=Pachysolen tannophilus NRRL Y-2460 TaxID=669874 RepID=A0A1E4U025_PACTA|nr:hypothetical protein PACTADRAFT_49084 [Pachysolen tannophilus NRRL Y-2460]
MVIVEESFNNFNSFESNVENVLEQVNDSLVYIDDEITQQEREEVNKLVTQELASFDVNKLYPSLENRYEILLVRKNKVEPLKKKNDEIIIPSIGGIDLTRYNNLTTESNELDYAKLYTSLAHSMLRQRSLTISNFNNDIIVKNKWLLYNNQLSCYNSILKKELNKKRKAIDDINEQRKKLQLNYKPLDEYLQNKWREEIKACVDVD